MSKRRNKSEWQRLIDEQAASGLSQKAFCAQRKISLATFGYWKRKLREEGTPRSNEQAAPQQVTLDDWIELAPPSPEPASGWRIELELGNGLCLRLSRG